MHQLLQARARAAAGVDEIRSLGKIERQDHRASGIEHLGQAAVLLSRSAHDHRQRELAAHAIRPQKVPFVGGIDDHGRRLIDDFH